MKYQLIAIDPGKHSCKSAGSTTGGVYQRFSMRSKWTRIENNNQVDLVGDSYQVRCDGTTYVMGEQGESVNYDINKAEESHKLAAYIAISKYSPSADTGEAAFIDFVIGCPVSIYKNNELRNPI